MDENKGAISRYQEFYLRYLFLFGNAVPLTIKAALKQKRHSVISILTKKKEHVQASCNDLPTLLLNEDIDAQIDSWTINTLCDVVLILNYKPYVDCIKCILDQLHDLDNYSNVASFNFLLFHLKWNVLRGALLKLSENTDAHFNCKRILHASKSAVIQISTDVFHKLKHVGDVGKHIEIVIKSVKLDREKEILMDYDKTLEVKDETVQIIQELSDKDVYTGDTVTFVTEFNKENCKVLWWKDGTQLTRTQSVYIFAERGSYFLIVTKATSGDSGLYKCTYKNLSTSASVTVTEVNLRMERPLQRENIGDISEYMEVSLSCIINIPGKIPRWYHNNQEIERKNPRVKFESKDYEHKLIIRRVELADEGEYCVVFDRVSSKTSITFKGPEDTANNLEIEKDLFKNWIRAVLGLKYLKKGLEEPAEQAAKMHHKQILHDLPKHISEETCKHCTPEILQPMHFKNDCPRHQNKRKCLCSINPNKRRQCPSHGLCSEIYDRIVSEHRYQDPCMKNAKIDKWTADPWSVAACYINSTDITNPKEYQYKTSSKELDCADMLSLFINNKTYIENPSNFEMSKKHRNDLHHNPKYEISDTKLQEYLEDFQHVLEVKNSSNKKVFVNFANVKESLKSLKELQHCVIDINTKEEIEKMKNEFRAVSMDITADKFEAAVKQKNAEFQKMELETKSREMVRTEQFVQQLSDTKIRAGESAVLMCELNKDDCPVVWTKNGRTLTKTQTVYPLSDKGRHCLVFTMATPEESGTYKCTYNGLSTSASFLVSNNHQPDKNMCEKHDGTEVSWYCKKDSKLICKTCMEKEHRLCSGLTELKETNKEQQVGGISVKYGCTYEQEEGEVIIICALPHGEFLVLLRNKNRK